MYNVHSYCVDFRLASVILCVSLVLLKRSRAVISHVAFRQYNRTSVGVGTGLSPSPSVGRWVGRSVCLSGRVYCGKMADRIWMPFGMVNGVVEGWVYWMGSTSPKGKGGVGGFSPHWFEWRFWVYFCIWLVCEKLTIFPYGQYIFGNVCSLSFWCYSQFWNWSWGLREICKKSNSDFTKKSCLAATFTPVNVVMATIALLVAHLFCAVWAILRSMHENLAWRWLCVVRSSLTALRYRKFM